MFEQGITFMQFGTYQSLKNLTANQQVGALFIIVFGVLLIASAVTFLWSLRDYGDDAHGQRRHHDLRNLEGVISTSWMMVLVFWLGWISGATVAIVLFGFVSFFCLREFLTLSPTKRGDHRSLILAFFVILPLQYWLVGTAHFELFTVFIPVYVFLLIPVVSALANDSERFLERNAKLQWGIMVCIYGLSHVPALLLLEFPKYNNKNSFLVFFLVIVVQVSQLVQHLVARIWKWQPLVPNISQSFNWGSALIGIAVGSALGGALAGITPFVPGQAFVMAFVACLAGSMGHLVMKALKRDRGIPIWRSARGNMRAGVTGAGGLLDRVDALCFAAPVFFHFVQWYFDLYN
jgi:phosphatidate cytidylyltransferase